MTDKEKIKELIKIGYSYRMLEKICDVHHTTLSNWCNNITELTPRILSRIHLGLQDHKNKINDILR